VGVVSERGEIITLAALTAAVILASIALARGWFG